MEHMHLSSVSSDACSMPNAESSKEDQNFEEGAIMIRASAIPVRWNDL